MININDLDIDVSELSEEDKLLLDKHLEDLEKGIEDDSTKVLTTSNKEYSLSKWIFLLSTYFFLNFAEESLDKKKYYIITGGFNAKACKICQEAVAKAIVTKEELSDLWSRGFMHAFCGHGFVEYNSAMKLPSKLGSEKYNTNKNTRDNLDLKQLRKDYERRKAKGFKRNDKEYQEFLNYLKDNNWL